jgi:ABC-type nickel/cobalt efflux system permease component RcnA
MRSALLTLAAAGVLPRTLRLLVERMKSVQSELRTLQQARESKQQHKASLEGMDKQLECEHTHALREATSKVHTPRQARTPSRCGTLTCVSSIA